MSVTSTSTRVDSEPSAAQHEPPATDAFHTSGTSPTRCVDACRTTFQTVHLLGPGAVGRALLGRLAASRRTLVAVTDSTATIRDTSGLDPLAVAAWKSCGRSLLSYPGAQSLPAHSAVALADADVVIDASSTDPRRAGWTATLDSALARGACVAFAAKAALCDAGAAWLSGARVRRIGCNAVLGGTGSRLTRELPELRRRWRNVAIVGNASTTTIIEAIERGCTLAEGVDAAARLGFLETDPELDLRGADAAVKIAIVAAALTGRRIRTDDVPCEDIRTLDLLTVRARARRGCTTRLVARLLEDGSLRVAYEEVARDSVLAAKVGHVVYDYHLDGSERRLHIGSGIGADATAEALWTDVRSLIAANSTGQVHAVAGGFR